VQRQESLTASNPMSNMYPMFAAPFVHVRDGLADDKSVFAASKHLDRQVLWSKPTPNRLEARSSLPTRNCL
jgi:hypothetical protein